MPMILSLIEHYRFKTTTTTTTREALFSFFCLTSWKHRVNFVFNWKKGPYPSPFTMIHYSNPFFNLKFASSLIIFGIFIISCFKLLLEGGRLYIYIYMYTHMYKQMNAVIYHSIHVIFLDGYMFRNWTILCAKNCWIILPSTYTTWFQGKEIPKVLESFSWRYTL